MRHRRSDQCLDFAWGRGIRQAQSRAERQCLIYRQFSVNNVILGNIAEELPEQIEIRIKVDVVDQYSACVRRAESAQRIEQSRFSGTAWSEDADELVRFNDQ